MLFDLPGCNPEQIQRTEAVLKSIAWHLSSKRKCKGKTYRVIIRVSESAGIVEQYASFECDEKLRSHRNRDYMARPLEHVISDHFPDYCVRARPMYCRLKRDTCVPGVYEYRLSASGRYRRWCKVG